MSHYLLYDGQPLKNDEPLLGADNRGLRYGDGLFETMKAIDGSVHLEQYHFERLFYGLEVLRFELPSYFTPKYLADQVKALCQKNNHNVARIRLAIVRGNGGVYDPENHFPHCIIQSLPLPEAGFKLNDNGLVTGIYTGTRKSIDILSNLKTNNYLPYTMAALHAKAQKWNEALLLNTTGRICDATIANVFVIRKDKIYTPALAEGCVAGVMRRWLIENLIKSGYTVEESGIGMSTIADADEIFLANSIQGIRWVQQCGETRYSNKLATLIYSSLLKNLL